MKKATLDEWLAATHESITLGDLHKLLVESDLSITWLRVERDGGATVSVTLVDPHKSVFLVQRHTGRGKTLAEAIGRAAFAAFDSGRVVL